MISEDNNRDPLTNGSPSPLPGLVGGLEAVSDNDNPWKVQRTSFPLTNEAFFSFRRPRGIREKIALSRFRRGNLVIEPWGLRMSGFGAETPGCFSKMSHYLPIVTLLVFAAFFVYYIESRIHRWAFQVPNHFHPLAIAFALYTVVVLVMVATYEFYEFRRVRMEEKLDWKDVIGVFVHPACLFVGIYYRPQGPESNAGDSIQLIIAKQAFPGMVRTMVSVVERSIPDKVHWNYHGVSFNRSLFARFARLVLVEVVIVVAWQRIMHLIH